MEELIDILSELKPGIDFLTEENLVEDGLIDSFDIISIIGKLSDEYDIQFPIMQVTPENFESAKTIYALVCKLQDNE